MKKAVCIFLSILFSISLYAQQPIVQDIQAQAGKGTKINVFWTLPQKSEAKITKFLVYRSRQQITSYNQIKDSEPIATLTPDNTGYTDSVKDLNDYFYAVIAVTDKPYDLILLSFNSTVTGTHIAYKTEQKEPVRIEEEKIYPDGTLRETPLPFIDVVEGFNKSDSISEEIANSTKALVTSNKTKTPLLSPYVFEEDLISPDAGDDYLLFEILKNTFIQKKYKEAIIQLNKLTGTNISESTRNRAYFYKGESEYLSGQYENAVRTFVKIESNYPVLAKKWLDSALDRI